MNEPTSQTSNDSSKVARRVGVPNEDLLVILHEIAKSRGIQIARPGRSRRLIELTGTKAEIEGAIADASRLGLLLQLRQASVLEKILQDNGLQAPTGLGHALAMMEAKCAVTFGEVPAPGKPVIHTNCQVDSKDT